jgi:hypothetical protein
MPLSKRPGKRDTLCPPTLPDEPITDAGTPTDDQRCPHTLPGCPGIRCQRPVHAQPGMCHAVGRGPYWAAYWEHPEDDR